MAPGLGTTGSDRPSNSDARSSSRWRRTAAPEPWTHPHSVLWSTSEPIIFTASTLEERLRQFEIRFDLPSDRFIEAFQNGELHESEEFLDWSLLYSAWEHVTRKR